MPVETALAGCRPAPLASYLKALAVLRLVAEQADPTARGAWRDDRFTLRARLDRQGLLGYFLDRYAPTPVVAPWNGGSGFYAGDSQKGIGDIEGSDAPRFDAYRAVIRDVRSWPEIPATYPTVGEVLQPILREVQRLGPGKKRDDLQALLDDEARARQHAAAADVVPVGDETELSILDDVDAPRVKAWQKAIKKLRTQCNKLARDAGGRGVVQREVRARLPDAAVAWIDAAFVLTPQGKPEFNPVLGTGGNEGRLDYTTRFMQHLWTLLGPERDRAQVRSWLESALFGEVAANLPELSIGQLDPGRAGGFNQGPGFEHKDFTANPWDFVLMIEGALLLAGAVHKRLGAAEPGALALPFAVRHVSAGFGSSGQDEARPEVWTPLWSRWASLPEVRQVFREGRAVVGRREARTALDFTRAARTWGVSRGVDTFVRHTFLKRRGDSFVALAAGRVHVRFDPRVRLLDDLDPILDAADRVIRSIKNPPARLHSLRRQVDERAFDAALRPGPRSFGLLVEALGQLEALLAVRAASRTDSRDKTRPLPARLSPAFLAACDDGSVEFRLAAALASIGPTGRGSDRVGPVRANLEPVDPAAPWRWAQAGAQRAWFGVSPVDRLGGVIRRRLVDAARFGVRTVPLCGRLALHPADVAAFVWRLTDDGRVERLLWGLLLVDWHQRDDAHLVQLQNRWKAAAAEVPVPRAWALLKLALWPGPVRGIEVRADPRIAALLHAGRVAEALSVARHRLRVAGLAPLPIASPGRDLDPARVLAALLPPVHGHGRLAALILVRDPSDDDSAPSPRHAAHTASPNPS